MKVATFTVTDYHYKLIDSLPFPDYEPFGIRDMMDNYSMATRLLYRYPRTNPRPYNIVASRSCPFSCTFCIHGHRNIPYRARSIPNIMAEIREAYDKYHFNILILLDELFAVNKARMVEFCEAVLAGKKEYGWDFDFMFQTHASAKLDLESLKLAKEAGCFFFSYGLESASPTVLKSMNKKIEVSQVVEAIKLSEEAKIGFGANLIFGDPVETHETIAESLAFWLEHGESSFVFLSNISPYPGSALFDSLRAKGMFRNKKEYYEKIDAGGINMTSMKESDFTSLMSLIAFLEKSWLFVKTGTILAVERLDEEDKMTTFAGGHYYRITARCPYCGEEVEYKERLMDVNQPIWLGTGCPECNRKIKVENRP